MTDWTRDSQTGKYIGYLRLEMDPELMQGMVLQKMKEDSTADLTSPTDLQRIIARVGSPASFVEARPHVRVSAYHPPTLASLPTPTPTPVSLPKERSDAPGRTQRPKQAHTGKRSVQTAQLEECARRTAPSLWMEQCRTPTFPAEAQVSSEERQNVGRLRYDEKKILELLYQQWQRGDFLLSEEAEEAERRIQGKEKQAVEEQIEAVALALKSNSLH